jgi:16S rRNA (guanine527-N7)-methyltransferase
MSREADRAAALALTPVSRETVERLQVYVDLLGRWRTVVNLVSKASFESVWTRHVADSAQLLPLAPEARVWVDMGSGAGFPGMVIAIQLMDVKGARVHLVESDQRKSAFLREAARATGAPVTVHNCRIEEAASEIASSVDAVTARALAPLPRLIAFATLWLNNSAIGVFPQGRGSEVDNFVFQNSQGYDFSFAENIVDRDGRILVVRKLALTGADSSGLAEN